MSFHGRSSQDKIHLSQAFKAPTHVLRAIMVGQVRIMSQESAYSGK